MDTGWGDAGGIGRAVGRAQGKGGVSIGDMDVVASDASCCRNAEGDVPHGVCWRTRGTHAGSVWRSGSNTGCGGTQMWSRAGRRHGCGGDAVVVWSAGRRRQGDVACGEGAAGQRRGGWRTGRRVQAARRARAKKRAGGSVSVRGGRAGTGVEVAPWCMGVRDGGSDGAGGANRRVRRARRLTALRRQGPACGISDTARSGGGNGRRGKLELEVRRGKREG